MRWHVVVLAAAMVAVAVVGLWFGMHEDDARVAPVEAVREVVRGVARDRTRPTQSAPVPEVTASSVARPRAPLNRYLAGDDLWNTYQGLRRSTNGGELWVAETILRSCFFLTRSSGIVQEILAGKGLLVLGAMTQEEIDRFRHGQMEPRLRRQMVTDDQVAAAREIAARCAPFAAMTSVEYRAQVNDTIGRRQHADDPVATAESIQAHRVQATDERMRLVLASQDPVAIDLISDELASRLAHRAQRMPTDEESTADHEALRLVECDLGNLCEADSETALVACMHLADLCRLGVAAQVVATATPFVRDMIEVRRQRMLSAIRDGDFAPWGL